MVLYWLAGSAWLSGALFVQPAHAYHPLPSTCKPAVVEIDKRFDDDPTSGLEIFSQQLDHADPQLGTFSQRYWWSSRFWAGPGSPGCRRKLKPRDQTQDN
ncbi:hypothetical protein GQ53DRAFT_216298 [Thozetella sp. PMI_491]|nr:hypothetical protein GQ53DRAFT_216298 [Thozetella sp. PMI_491]